MAHDHHHSHAHGAVSSNLRMAFFLNLAFTVFELFGGVYVNSVAIISDAIHDLGDSLSLGTAWYLQVKSRQGADQHFTFGYARFSLLGALINSLVLIGGSVFVINEAVGRIREPEATDAGGMIVFAVVGIAVNGYAAWKMSGGKSLNERVVSWHLLEDVLGWVAVLIVGLILSFYDNPYLDPALSLLITAYILYGVTGRLKETLLVFLQGTPRDVDLLHIQRQLQAIDKVHSLHHTHVWSLEGEQHVFTTHLKLHHIDTFEDILEVKSAAKEILGAYPFTHYTIETELDQETCGLVQSV
jgi:cobalt-zinc-cadmium efflux system protein